MKKKNAKKELKKSANNLLIGNENLELKITNRVREQAPVLMRMRMYVCVCVSLCEVLWLLEVVTWFLCFSCTSSSFFFYILKIKMNS